MNRLIALFILTASTLIQFPSAHANAQTGASHVTSQKSEKATLAAGCFWGTEEFFRKVPGVLATQVGYSGGKQKNPSYEDVSSGQTGHAESLDIEFDPKQVNYEQLLVMFFEMHDPTTANQQGNDKGTQYRSAIFYHTNDQRTVAEQVIKKVEASGAWKAKLMTELSPAGVFFPAETYHQKYLLKNPGGYDNHYYRNFYFGPGLPKIAPPKP